MWILSAAFRLRLIPSDKLSLHLISNYYSTPCFQEVSDPQEHLPDGKTEEYRYGLLISFRTNVAQSLFSIRRDVNCIG
jgi:hypothetical protein